MEDRTTPKQAGAALRAVIVDGLNVGTLEMAYRADFLPTMIRLGYWPCEIDGAVAYCIGQGWVIQAPGGLRLLTTDPSLNVTPVGLL